MIGLPPQSRYWSNGLQASGYITVNGVPANGATVTINGDVYTFGTDFMGNFANDISDALVAAINADEADIEHTGVGPKPIRVYFAAQYGNRVWIGASSPGTAGNAFTLATSDATNFTVSGATLSGGTAGPSTTVGTVDQGAANTNTNGWPVKITDGTDVLGTVAHPLVTSATFSGAVAQGTAAAIGAPWPAILSDGSAALGTTGNRLFVQGSAGQGTAAAVGAPWPVLLSDGAAALGTTGNRLFVQGSAAQGTAASIGAPWPAQLSDGSAALGVQANPLIVDDQRISSAPSSSAVLSTQTTLASNASRKRFWVQNLGTSVLWVAMAATASATTSNWVLKAGTANDDGNGGLIIDSDYTGSVTVFTAGTYRYSMGEQT